MLATAAHRMVSAAIRRWRTGRIIDRARRARDRGGAEAAIQVLMRGVTRHPHDAELWNDLASLQIERQDMASASQAVHRALQLSPDLPQAHCNLGIVLAECGEEAGALRSFERALHCDPDFRLARENRAILLSDIPRLDDAIAAWEEIVRYDPGHKKAHAMLGGLLMRAGRFAEARERLDMGAVLAPGAPEIALYRAVIDAETGDPASAIQTIEALRGNLKDANLDWNLAVIHLSQGDYERGWPLYEARPTRSRSRRRSYGLPEWEGAPVPPGSLLVMAEQGLGDEVMFASCYPDLLERAPNCVIECDPRLAPLYRRSFPEAQVAGVAQGKDCGWIKDFPQLRSQILTGSLPRFFRARVSDFPKRTGFLRPDPVRTATWRSRIAALPGDLKIGIAWNGGLAHTRRALRCVPLEQLANLIRSANHSFVSLQHDDDGREALRLSELSGRAVHRFPESLADLDEQAALLSALDVVITVCSSVVHLSGAVGARTWVLTPRIAEWRYLRSGAALPWYPSVRLFRQAQQDGQWHAVLAQVAEALSGLAQDRVEGRSAGADCAPRQSTAQARWNSEPTGEGRPSSIGRRH